MKRRREDNEHAGSEVRAQLARWLEFPSCNNSIPILKEARESHPTQLYIQLLFSLSPLFDRQGREEGE